MGVNKLIINLLIVIVIFKTFWSIGLWLANLKYSTGPNAKIPPVLSDMITPEDFEKTKSYMKDKAPVSVISSIVDLALSLWLLLKGFPLLETIAKNFSDNVFVQSLIFFAIYGLIELIVDLPFDLYNTFVLEEKYGFNKTTPKTFIMDIVKSIIISIVVGAPVILALVWFLIKFEIWWWQVSIFAIAITILFSFIFPILIAPLFNKFKELEEGELKKKIKTLLEKSKIKIPNVYVMDASKRTKRQNAYLTGIGKSRRLVLYDNILTYSDDEILAVVGHELGHHKRRHISKLLIINILYEFFIFYVANKIYIILSSQQPQGVSQPYTVFVYSVLFITSIMFFVRPIFNYLSRKFEYEADNYSAELLGTAKPMISSLKKLVKENLSNPNPLPLYKTWYYSHPAPEERINNLLKIENE